MVFNVVHNASRSKIVDRHLTPAEFDFAHEVSRVQMRSVIEIGGYNSMSMS